MIQQKFRGYLRHGQMPVIEQVPAIFRMEFFVEAFTEITVINMFLYNPSVHKNK